MQIILPFPLEISKHLFDLDVSTPDPETGSLADSIAFGLFPKKHCHFMLFVVLVEMPFGDTTFVHFDSVHRSTVGQFLKGVIATYVPWRSYSFFIMDITSFKDLSSSRYSRLIVAR